MKISLEAYRNQYRELVLNFLWRQWSALGVAGSAQSDDDRIIDPEALLIFTCTMARFDARLFDEVLDWLHRNGEFLNVQRLKRILKTEPFSGQPILSAVAALLCNGEDALKWKRLAGTPPDSAETQPLFFLSNGRPIPTLGELDPTFEAYGYLRNPLTLRGYSLRFQPTVKTNLLLQLRTLFGANARSEVIAYLLTHENAHPSLVARETYYNQKTVQNTLVDMACSGVIRIKTFGREKRYWVKPDAWNTLLGREHRRAGWITWPPFFSALESIWFALNDEQLRIKTDSLLIASRLRQIMMDVQPQFEKAGFETMLSDDRQYRGEAYSDVFLSDIQKLLS